MDTAKRRRGRRRTGGLLKRGKVWYAVWNVGRKRFVKTTGKTDRDEALVELRRIMEPFAVGDEITTLEHVRARIEGARADLTKLEDERNPPLSVTGAWSAYLASAKRPKSGPGTLAHYEGQWMAFAAWLRTKHPDAVALRDVSPEIAEEYAAHLTRERKLAGNSFNKHVRFLTLLFRVLKKKKSAGLTNNPWEEIEHEPQNGSTRRELTVEELRRVCVAATGELRLLLALGVYCGLRLGDAATLRWGEVDLVRRTIRRVPNKTARHNPKPLEIPIHPTLAVMLAETPPTARRDYVLPDTAALYLSDAPGLSKKIQEHFESCGIRTHAPGTGFVRVRDPETGEEQVVHTGKRAVIEASYHSLRHSFVSLCREANAPLSVVEAIVGHSNPAMTRHYTHASPIAAAAAVAALPAVVGEAPAPKAARDPLAALKLRVQRLAEGLTPETAGKIRRALLRTVTDEFPPDVREDLENSTHTSLS